MKSSFEYRNYLVTNENGLYVATPGDGDDFRISSVYMMRVLRSIDALWSALEHVTVTASSTVPLWIKDWIANPTNSINLDLANGAAPPAAPVEILSFPAQKLAVIGKPSAATA